MAAEPHVFRVLGLSKKIGRKIEIWHQNHVRPELAKRRT
jgi:hypothetical protein